MKYEKLNRNELIQLLRDKDNLIEHQTTETEGLRESLKVRANRNDADAAKIEKIENSLGDISEELEEKADLLEVAAEELAHIKKGFSVLQKSNREQNQRIKTLTDGIDTLKKSIEKVTEEKERAVATSFEFAGDSHGFEVQVKELIAERDQLIADVATLKRQIK